MWSWSSPIKCATLAFAFVEVATPTAYAGQVQQGQGTVHGDLLTSSTEWPSLELHFKLKRGSMQVFGQPEFDVYANPVVSDDGLYVTYNGYVDFTEGSTLTRYTLVDGVAYSTTTSDTQQDQAAPSTPQCMSAKELPPINDLLSALNEATPVSTASLDGKKIKCKTGNPFKVTFHGLNLAVCASGSAGAHAYGSDMDIVIKYLDKPVEIKANASVAGECDTVVNATAVTSTTSALLTGEPIPESESRSLDFGSVFEVPSSSCSCKSTPRPCVFIHGLGVDYAEPELQDSLSSYWGNLTDHAPCCTEFKYMVWNSVETGWNNNTQQQTLCDLVTTATDSGSPTEIADTIVVTHSMGGLLLAGAIASGKCTLEASSSWIATSPPMTGSMGSDYAQDACNGDHTILMETIGNVTGECPVLGAAMSVAYENGGFSTPELNEEYRAAQAVYEKRVHAVMCSNSFAGLFSRYQPMYWLLGEELPHKSSENDGMVEFASCAGGFPVAKFGDLYTDQFYVTRLNHADTTFYNGDGLFSSAKKPIKWFECVL